MRGIGTLRERLVVPRRSAVLADTLSRALFDAQTALDVGCGEGSIDLLIQAAVPGLMIRGVDVLVWPEARIPVETFDGYQLPFDDKSFDTVIFIDVLHHTDDPMVLLREAKRVARRAIVLKDHTADGALADLTPAVHGLGRERASQRDTTLQLLVGAAMARCVCRTRAWYRAMAEHAGALSLAGVSGIRTRPAFRDPADYLRGIMDVHSRR